MPIPYLKMSDGTLVISLSDKTINKPINTLNYNIIEKLLQDDSTTEEQLTKLLEEKATNGLFYALNYKNTLIIKHIDNNYKVSYTGADNKLGGIDSSLCTTLGVFSSKEAIIDTYPEYFI